MLPDLSFAPGTLRARYLDRSLRPTDLVEELLRRLEACPDPAVWIHRLSADELRAHAGRLESLDPAALPLYGLPFAIKDNIDLAGAPTTAACPGYAYTPAESASAVARLLAAGAIPVGKTNLDQFATGLVGTRSPHGAPRNVFNSHYISGGSSSGSAVAVARGLVSFALGTDTAGSGRVPAGLNGIVGLKPTRGRVPTRGVVPACRSLDCVSVFAPSVTDAAAVLAVLSGFDERDPFSRRAPAGLAVAAGPRVGVPRADQLEWFGDAEAPGLFAAALERLRAAGAEIMEVDFSAFLEAARLLYEGPWTAERFAAVGEFMQRHAATPAEAGLDPTVTEIILGGAKAGAADAFRASYRLAELRRAAEGVLAQVDALAAPTIPGVYTVEEIAADPIRLNSRLGRYNNFMNLLDLCGLTLPAGRWSAGPGFGLTLICEAWRDEALAALGARFLGEAEPAATPKAAGARVRLAVVGAHLSGLPLNSQLTERGARLVWSGKTAPVYRLHVLPGATPPKPGMLRVAEGGAAIALEVWELDEAAFGGFVAAVPAPLCIGGVELETGERVKGFLCEASALAGAPDITAFGGWRAYCTRP